jgi:two-component system response regulator AtoC
MQVILESLPRIAESDVAVLFQGESGVGKEVLARQLHALSHRAQNPFLKINCAALPAELLESELFGYERGAFTGAFRMTAGKFELANGGAILLDEIGDMDIRLQAKLLHVLQDGEYQRLGGGKTVRVDVRILAATHHDLEEAVERGEFRQDLFYRLNVIRVRIPPLRDRREEIPALVRHFLDKHGYAARPGPELTGRLMHAFLHYDWPGNIRELENAIQRLIVLDDADVVAGEFEQAQRRLALDRPPALRAAAACAESSQDAALHHNSAFEEAELAKRGMEALAIEEALRATAGNRKRAAELLGVKYKALLYRMKKLELNGRTADASNSTATER